MNSLTISSKGTWKQSARIWRSSIWKTMMKPAAASSERQSWEQSTVPTSCRSSGSSRIHGMKSFPSRQGIRCSTPLLKRSKSTPPAGWILRTVSWQAASDWTDTGLRYGINHTPTTARTGWKWCTQLVTSHPGTEWSAPVFFFTGYVMFSDIVGITKLYQRYKIYDIFISFLRNCIFMFFKNLILIYAWKSLPPSKEMSPENVKTCEWIFGLSFLT